MEIYLSVLFIIQFAGDVLFFRVFVQVTIVLNSAKTTKDLLEKRGNISSDRPVIPFYEMCVLSIGTPTSHFYTS